MRTLLYLSLGLAPALTGVAQAEENRIELRNLAARVVVTTQPRADIDVRVKSGPKAMPQVTLSRSGGKVVVSGNVSGSSQSCGSGSNIFAFNFGDRNVTTVRVAGKGQVNLGDLPVVYIYAPENLQIVSNGAVYGTVNSSAQLKLNVHGCGDWQLGSVRGPLSILSTGSGDIHASNAGDTEIISGGSGDVHIGNVRGLKLSQSGSGDVGIGSVSGALSTATSGSGDISVGTVNGPVEISVAGSGDVTLAKGSITRLKIAIAGSGDVHFGGDADMVEAAIVGSGDIFVARANGTVQKSVLGSGDISIGRH
ncbi:MAG: DUF2807 domain-containing protein [Asticcacaulis sp.]